MLDGAHRLGLTTEIEIDLSDPTDVSVTWLGRKILTLPRQALQPVPSRSYRDLTVAERDEFLAHLELRKVALGTCGRDYGTPCAHENACVRCPLLRVDPGQMPRLEAIHANLVDRLNEAR
jgi:hypothetical protein